MQIHSLLHSVIAFRRSISNPAWRVHVSSVTIRADVSHKKNSVSLEAIELRCRSTRPRNVQKEKEKKEKEKEKEKEKKKKKKGKKKRSVAILCLC